MSVGASTEAVCSYNSLTLTTFSLTESLKLFAQKNMFPELSDVSKKSWCMFKRRLAHLYRCEGCYG